MKTQIMKVMRMKIFALVLACWPLYGLAAGTDDSHAKEKIEALLVQARTALAQDRLTIPSGDNAVGYAQEVLNALPGHPEAQRILTEVVERYGLIAGAALDRAEALRDREIEKARTYRSRGESVAVRHSLPDEKFRGIAERIAALDKESFESVEKAITENQPQGREMLKRVVARYLDKSEDALDLGGVQEARLYHDIARELVQTYRLPETGLQSLDRYIAEAEANYGKRNARTERAQAKAAREQIIPARLQSVFLPPAF